MLESFLNGRVIVKVGDLTDEDVDAIVNAANSSLLGGGGVDGAIHTRGGPQILEECRLIRENQYPDGLPTGLAVLTSGGNLAARYVVHTVGPIYGMNGENDARLLEDCYRNSLELATGHGLNTIAFPSISTGAYGFPKQNAARISSKAIRAALDDDEVIKEVRLTFHSLEDAKIFLDQEEF